MATGQRLPAAILVAAALAAAGCSGSSERPASDRAPAGGELRVSTVGWKTDFTRHSVPLREFLSGGPGRDGIPPVDRPRPIPVAGGEKFLDPQEPVLAVEVGGRARAYPHQILVWHEIVNDTLGGLPIAVTYCPLCNSSLVFDRRVAGRTLSFGTTGNLRRSDLVMWDRPTESWWQQLTGEAVVGRLTGARLTAIASQTLSFEDFRRRYPDGEVLSRETGIDRSYGSNLYTGYDQAGEQPFLLEDKADERLPPKERVLSIIEGDDAVDGRKLTFAAVPGDLFRDRETGSTWDVTGHASSGSLAGRRLEPVRHDVQSGSRSPPSFRMPASSGDLVPRLGNDAPVTVGRGERGSAFIGTRPGRGAARGSCRGRRP